MGNVFTKEGIQQLSLAECARIIDRTEDFRLTLTSEIYESYDVMKYFERCGTKEEAAKAQGANEAYHEMYRKLDKILHPERKTE